MPVLRLDSSIVLFILISVSSFSQNFRVISFEEALSDLSVVKYARSDVNDEQCAIIKVYTNLDALFSETRLGIEGDVFICVCEFWRKKSIWSIYNLWISDIVVVELFCGLGREYAMDLDWISYSSWDLAPDTTDCKGGIRAAVRVSPHVELFRND